MESFDRDDDVQCGLALRHLLDIAVRGSMMRVDPRNKIVDPTDDTLEHHPEVLAVLEAAQAFASMEPAMSA